METKIYRGLLSLQDWGEAWDILFLSSLDDPFGEVLQEDIAGKKVTARYWITNKEATKEEATESLLVTLSGMAECNFGSCYSEITGYLWTDEECNIGGHDLLGELHGHVGKWLILKVDIH